MLMNRLLNYILSLYIMKIIFFEIWGIQTMHISKYIPIWIPLVVIIDWIVLYVLCRQVMRYHKLFSIFVVFIVIFISAVFYVIYI